MTGDPCPGCVEEVEGGAIAKGSGGISSGTCHFRQTNQLESMSKISLAWLFNGFFKAGVEDWKIENSSQFTAPACPLLAPCQLVTYLCLTLFGFIVVLWQVQAYLHTIKLIGELVFLQSLKTRSSNPLCYPIELTVIHQLYQTTSPCFLGSKHDNTTLIKPTFDA